MLREIVIKERPVGLFSLCTPALAERSPASYLENPDSWLCRGFISFMAALQVPSLTVGGALWFTDLTIADPYYLLPIAASAIFLLTVELGAVDGMQACAARSNSVSS